MTRPSAAVPALLIALVAGGCNVFGVVADKVKPPEVVPARYDLSEQRASVRVFADERVLGSRAILDVDPVTITMRRALREEGEIAVVAGEEGVPTIVVELLPPEGAGPTIASDYDAAGAAATVRVVTFDGTQIWPDDGTDGHRVETELRAGRPAGRGEPAEVRRRALRKLGLAAARLFYPYEATAAMLDE